MKNKINIVIISITILLIGFVEIFSILPNSLKTEIIVTMNLREWRHFFRLRTALNAHPQMREIACAILDEFQKRVPVIFDDIDVVYP